MIEIDGLTKRYGRHTVVDGLSFSCGAGEVLGFLGPNGAGKSTTMKMLTGFVAPTAGSASVCGHDVQSDSLEARRRIGYLPEGAPSYAEMTPAAFLEFIADVRELGGALRKRRLDEVVERLHLGPVLQQSIDTLSKGFKRRVGLAQAILHDPEVLILDEPTDGLDPNQKHEVRELIRSMAEDKLIVISTHILEEVEAVCSRAIIIANGRILADDTPEHLAARSRYHNAVRVTLGEGADLDAARAAIGQLGSVSGTEADRKLRSITALAADGGQGAAAWRDVSDLAAAEGWAVAGLQLEAGRLDEVFRQITEGAAT
ncbi:MAG: ATP-binding cassette domain-containing protein [Gammaproteobacteria bacterium]|nr:ATP-binding cassette domain-containing protein [Gammaproteobacteria bacterium]MDH4254630.1 ATP-binding cassette domain-containing protein [Gammaproteobacteria bacterium]MDH5309458.1 ATP-binding cassette domain-containing protein [Gammaproteobacteria bacterium]